MPACLPCLSEASRELLAPRLATRIALLGDSHAAEGDIHLLVEFARGAPGITLDQFLHWQRELHQRCGCTVQLVFVNRLEELVAADVVALTVLFDASVDG